jgi:hypothetical protein
VSVRLLSVALIPFSVSHQLRGSRRALRTVSRPLKTGSGTSDR